MSRGAGAEGSHVSYCQNCGMTVGESQFCGNCGADSWVMSSVGTSGPMPPAPPLIPPPLAYGRQPVGGPYSPYTAAYGYAPPRLHPLKGLATAQTWLFGTIAAICALLALMLLSQYSAASRLMDEQTLSAAKAYNDAAAATGVMLILYYLAMLAVGIVMIIWLWRAISNLDVWPNPPRRLGPGWAIGGWFIPIAALFIPKQLLNDAWRGASPVGTNGLPWALVRVPAILNLYWAGWVVGTIFLAIGNSVASANTYDGVRTGALLATVGAVVLAGGAVCAIFAVREITARQHRAAEAIGALID